MPAPAVRRFGRGSIFCVAEVCFVLWPVLQAKQSFVANDDDLQRGGTGNPGAGAAYGQFVYKYNDFVAAHMTDGMAIYYNVPSM